MARVSCWRAIRNRTHEISVNVITGEPEGPKWSIVISRRTGRYAAGNEVREGFAWFHNTGKIDFKYNSSIRKWLRKVGDQGLYKELKQTIKNLVSENNLD